MLVVVAPDMIAIDVWDMLGDILIRFVSLVHKNRNKMISTIKTLPSFLNNLSDLWSASFYNLSYLIVDVFCVVVWPVL